MANNWRYYQETGQAGGTTALQYVDSFNGDDANSGSYDAPKQSIQGAFDAGANNMTLILAGYFNEGDWLAQKNCSLIQAEGYTVIDGMGKVNSINQTPSSGRINMYNFGILHIKNFTGTFNFLGLNADSGARIKHCIFENIINFINGTGGRIIREFSFNTLINTNPSSSGTGSGTSVIVNNTFINSSYTINSSLNHVFNNNFLDISSTINIRNFIDFNYNCILGTAIDGQKIRVNNVWYENTEDLQINTSFAQNDLPSTTDPKFNLINFFDYTLKPSSPLARAGKGNIHIGAYSVAKATPSNDVTWTATGVDNTTDPNQAVLTGSPTGTLESGLIEISDKVRRVTRINMPDFEIAPSLGETIGRLASDRTPYNVSVEIQYSTDGVTTNGTWLQVPVGTQPFHDTVNDVGNDYEDFDMANATAIFASHLKYRITMRDNEVQV